MKKLNSILIALVSVVIITFTTGMNSQNKQNSNKNKNTYTINKIWEMPKELEEISGIVWLNNGLIASIQDEDGIIFIYDLNKNKIVQEIEFADKGDFEGIAINNNDAYVMRSDGVVFEVLDYRSTDKKVSHFETSFKSKNNMETLFYDKHTQSLITTPKHVGLKTKMIKGVYRIPVASKKMDSIPFIEIDMHDEALKEFQKKKPRKTFYPSDLAIHPQTGEYYVLEGKKPKLLILDPEGNIKKVYVLDKDDFRQPEGITFDAEGQLYISNEKNKSKANIIQVDLN